MEGNSMYDTLTAEARAALKDEAWVLKALRNYARDLGVSVEHVITGSLMMVAEDYNRATGNGVIPCLQAVEDPS
jgi:hypothetical protein